MKATDSRILSIDRDDDGYWILLRSGWCDDDNPQCHTISEDTKRGALRHGIMRCPCKDCQRG